MNKMSDYVAELRKHLGEATEESTDMDLKMVIAQLALGMEAMGLDRKNPDDVEKFTATLKMLAGPKKQLLMQKMGTVSDTKLVKAVKAGKAGI